MGVLPTMMLAGRDLAEVRALIDRGVGADRTNPTWPFLCMYTSDTVRSARCISVVAGGGVTVIVGNSHPGPTMGYFQGLAVIEGWPAFPLGAWSDALTSAGGIAGAGQTTVWEHLARGATGSYGTIEEPYAVVGKFADPIALRASYVSGDTLVEAVYKSVRYPYQGLTVGEPLASPWQHELAQ
jgi:uncharacterized protein (TIGR03790 family)